MVNTAENQESTLDTRSVKPSTLEEIRSNKSCEIKINTSIYEMNVLTLHNAQRQYAGLKYTAQAKYGSLGVVLGNSEEGYIFYVLKLKGAYLR